MLSVPLRSKRRKRALALQKYQHAIPAVPLVFAGVRAIAHGERGFAFGLAIFEIVTSALLLGTVVHEIRKARRPPAASTPHAHHGVDWVHLFAAGVLIVEAVERWHLTHHWARPTLLTAAVTLGLGLGHGRIERYAEWRRALRIDDGGIYVGGAPFRAFRATWDELSSIAVGDRFARIRTRSGRERKIDFNDLEDVAQVRAALEDARQRLAAIEARRANPLMAE